MKSFAATALALAAGASAAAVSVVHPHPQIARDVPEPQFGLHFKRQNNNSNLPTTVIGGIEVVDTQIVRDAHALIQQFPDFLYFHSLRTWLFGAAALNNNATLKARVDLEVHALGTILHDLGWDQSPNSPWVTTTRRFEVDGALGATAFVRAHPDGAQFDDVRLEKIYDGISLHGTGGVGQFKNVDVVQILAGIGYDYPGAKPAQITQADFDSIVAEFTQEGVIEATNQTFTWLAQTKPATTYDNFLQPFGENYVPGYSAVGHRLFDTVTNAIKSGL